MMPLLQANVQKRIEERATCPQLAPWQRGQYQAALPSAVTFLPMMTSPVFRWRFLEFQPGGTLAEQRGVGSVEHPNATLVPWYHGMMGSAIPIDDFMRMQKPQVVVLEVCTPATGTKGEPPRARVRIVEVLHGSLLPGEYDAVFAPDNQESWYAIRNGGDQGLVQWRAMPYASPPSGERIIVAGELRADGTLDVWARSLRPDSAPERTRLRALFAEGT